MADTVGIVGLGQIGAALAERFVATGDAPVVFDTRQGAIDDAVAVGAIAAESATAIGERCGHVLIAVRDDAQCIDAVRAVVARARPDTIVAVLSTVTPETIAAVAEAASARGVRLVDAPVAGQGPVSVRDGTMSVLVGGDDDTFALLRPTFDRFASHVIHAGPTGSGAVLKLAHNVMVYVGYAGVIEALALAEAAGVRDGLVEEVTRRSGTLSAQSDIFLQIYERRRRGITEPEEDEIMRISAALLDKDLRHAVAVAAQHGRSLPVSNMLEGTGDDVYVVTPPTDR